ncbi:MAG: biopolymer transporter TolR [Sediminibacterium sp.]|nr:biopolymer transporter TolR [Sediminibacterium sp.]
MFYQKISKFCHVIKINVAIGGICFAMLLICLNAYSQQQPLGIFDGQSNVGNAIRPGSATYLSSEQQYILTGAGYNIWFEKDEFHYAWKRITGNFILYARAAFAGSEGVDPHRKLGWMIRKNLDANAPHISAAVHGDGLAALQYRKITGAQTEEKKSGLKKATIIQLERKGNVYTMRIAKYGEPFVTEQVADIEMGNEVYVGLFVGSHNADVSETALFSDVSVSIPYPGIADQRTPMVLGSNLELLDIASGKREIVYTQTNSIQAPNWLQDGKTLLYNDSKGMIYTFSLDTHKATLLNTGTVTNNNNDHVLSFDSKMLGLSSNVKELGGSIIYTVPIEGGIPKQITPKGPSYLHGWSPDSNDLVYCAERNGNYDVYKIPAEGGNEIRLTDAQGLDDGPEYTPDGKYIYFNSVRSGLMQVWRMRPDGTQQEQVTNDTFNNWFPHISPDGKWMVYLSFLQEEVEPGIHPPYQHVYIRLQPVNGGASKVLAYVYGGQGSINTPSWSPDSKRIAFISNSDMRQ